MSLNQAHADLLTHFRSLREERGDGKLYFLEHALDADDLVELTSRVSECAGLHSLSDPWWQSRCLPLLVVATEVGYLYCGTGTDFWPLLEAELKTQLSHEDRAGLSDRFREMSGLLGGAAPPETPWGEYFHHIAWPITHAVLPMELQRPFAQALSGLRLTIREDTPADHIQRALSFSAESLGGERYRAWLDDAELVATLARAVLGGWTSSELEPMTLRRIQRDLLVDRASRAAVSEARRRQKVATARSSGTSTPVLRSGTLSLVKDGRKVRLMLTLPSLPEKLTRDALTFLRRRRYAARLWGATRPVMSDRLLSGLPFELLELESWPESDAALLPSLAQLELPAPVLEALSALRVRTAQPLLFQERAGTDTAVQLTGERATATAGGCYWLLAAGRPESVEGVSSMGRCAGLFCARVDTQHRPAMQWLRDQGVPVVARPRLRWIGHPPITRSGSTLAFLPGDFVGINVTGQLDEPLRVSLGEGQRETSHLLSQSGTLRMDSIKREAQLTVGSGNFRETRRLQKVGIPSMLPVCSVRLEGGELTLDALLRRELSLRVEAPYHLERLPVQIRLSAGSRAWVVERIIPHTPFSLGQAGGALGGDQLWDELLRPEVEQLLRDRHQIELSAHIGALVTRSWHLEAELAPVWWDRSEERGPVALTDAGEVPTAWIGAGSPLDEGVLGQAASSVSELGILVPVGSAGGWLGGACEGPHGYRTTRGWTPGRPQRLARQVQDHGRAVGLERLIRAYLQWRLSTARDVAVDVGRRQVARALERWGVDLVCGQAWLEIEDRIWSQGASDPWWGLVQCCQETGLGFQEVDDLSVEEHLELATELGGRLAQALPDLWQQFDGWGSRDDPEHLHKLTSSLDTLVCDCYEVLAEQARASGNDERAEELDDVDPGYPPEEWRVVLSQAKERAHMLELSELLCPTDAARHLVLLDYGHMTLDAVLEELGQWTKAHAGALQGARRWTDEEIDVALSLWTQPTRAVRLGWSLPLERMATDRWTARAVRYAALRFVAARGRLGGAL